MDRRLPLLIGIAGALSWGQGTKPGMSQKAELLTLECRGEEPFWGLRANQTSAAYSRPGEEATFQGGLQMLPGQPMWAVWRGTAVKAPTLSLVLVVREEVCRSTMADESESPAMSHRAVLSLKEGEAAMGCCKTQTGLNPAKAPAADFAAKPATDWSKLLPDLLPAVQLCVLEGGLRADRVVKAWPMNRGKVGVRLISKDHAEMDCVADATGKGAVEMSTGRTAPAGAGHPVFYPAREQPPIVQCGRLEKVESRAGALAGYLHYGCQATAQCDPGLVDADRSLLAEFEVANKAFRQGTLTRDEYRKKIDFLQKQESAILMRASAQQCEDMAIANYWTRGRLKFPSPIGEARKRLAAGGQ